MNNTKITVLTLLVLLPLIWGCGGSETAEVGELIYLEGEVTLNGSPASIGMEINDADLLSTGSGSYAEVLFGTRRILRAEENSNVVFDAASHTLKMESGALAVVQSKANFFSRDNAWDLQTQTTVAAVRGTVYYVKVEDKDSTYFCLCNGKIHLESTDEQEAFDLEASHHKAVWLKSTANGIIRENAPMIYHTDEEMENLADRVNIAIDWDEIN